MTNTKDPGRTRVTVTIHEPAIARKKKAASPGPLAKTISKAAFTAKPITAKVPTNAIAKTVAKPKLVRDSFTIPKSEYVVLEDLKTRAANLARPTKKSELLRAGIAVLDAMNDKAFLAALENVPSLKTGRPKSLEAT